MGTLNLPALVLEVRRMSPFSHRGGMEYTTTVAFQDFETMGDVSTSGTARRAAATATTA